MQVGQLEGEVQLRHQFAGEDQPAIHDAEHHRIALGQLGVDGFGNLGDRRFDLLLGVQAVCLGHDLANMCEIDGHEAIPPESLVGSTSRGWQLERLNRRDARRTRTAKNLTEQPISGRSRKGGEDTHPRRAQQVCRPDDTRIAADPTML